jgi:hypothetical protein
MIAPGYDLVLLRTLGYDIQVKDGTKFLAEPWTHLVVIRHSSDEYGAIMIMPVVGDSEDDWSTVMSSLLRVVPDELQALGILMSFGVCHDEPYIETIRIAKEAAIMDQRFDEAADLRDIERKLQRGTY